MKPEHTLQLSSPSQWVSLYGDYLFSIAMMKVNNRETAEDIVQETFLSAIKAAGTFKGNSSEKTWLVTILNNKIIDYYRKNDVLKHTDTYLTDTDRSFYDHFFESDGTHTGHWLHNNAPRHWEPKADENTDRKEFYRILEYCLSKLPSRLAPVFMAKFMDEEASEIICKEFGISSSNYWVMIHRAKILMRSCLETNWFITSK